MKLISKLILYLITSSVRPKVLCEMAEIKMCIAYIKTLKIMHSVIIEMITLAACIFFIATGIILLHIGLIAYGPWTDQNKLIITSCIGGGYLLFFSLILFYKISPKRWMKLFKGNEVIKKFL